MHSGPYGFPYQLIQEIITFIVEPLKEIINLSFETGIFPNTLKLTKFVSIPKKKVR